MSLSLMIQGTTSDAGKSIAVAALCRLLLKQGVKVAPFKPQNMALNSAVTKEGGEIGRAQALQAAACKLEPHTDMNPVLLKPESDQGSQVIINGKVVSQLQAREFGNIKALAFDSVLAAFNRLQQQYDCVVVEGAGSPAEINLRKNDIANMGFAEAADCPVILIADIDKGGVFAHIVGTLECLSASERERVKGFIINKFRGNLNLLKDGLDWLEQKTAKPVLGVIPYIRQLKLDAEDAIAVSDLAEKNTLIKINIPVFARISNHTDFDPLIHHPNIDCRFVAPGESILGADLIILPGSKQVAQEMQLMKQFGWDLQIKQHLRYGGKVLGICGGFQLLGNKLLDPNKIESEFTEISALGLLDFQTEFQTEKRLTQVKGHCQFSVEQSNETFPTNITGYEIHCGLSVGPALKKPFAQLGTQTGEAFYDGAVSEDGQVIGTYIHGLFEQAEVVNELISWVCDAALTTKALQQKSWSQVREQEIERLAHTFAQHLDMPKLFKIIGVNHE